MESASLRKMRKKVKDDRKRILRVVEYLYFGASPENFPIEIADGYIVSDVDDYSVFASFVIRNLSKKSIRSLKIRLDCYQYANVPYLKIPFEYNHDIYTLGERRRDGERIKNKRILNEGTVYSGETFGEAIYIPLPESYFKRMEVEVTDIVFSDGEHIRTKQVLGRTVDRTAFSKNEPISEGDKVRKYYDAMEKFPVVSIPQVDSDSWLCCCGYRNMKDTEKCVNCSREKNWQLKHLSGMDISSAKRDTEIPQALSLFEGDKYKQNKYMDSKEDVERKIEQYNKAMQNIAFEENRSEKLKIWFIPKLILALLAVWLLAEILIIIFLK